MSILLAIGRSHGDRARSRRAASAGGEDNGPIFVDWSGPKVASTASRARPAIGKRNTAEPFYIDLDLRLEHKLQTATRRQRRARPWFRKLATMRRDGITRLSRYKRHPHAVRVALNLHWPRQSFASPLMPYSWKT